MKTIFSIAKNTFRETIRDKILYTIFGFSLVFILSDLFFAEISLNDPAMIKAFGLASLYLFGSVITIFLASSIIYKEIERRTLYFVLSKPVKRSQVIIGKFAGLLSAIIVTSLLMAIIYLGVIWYATGIFDSLALFAILFQLIESALFIAVLIFFSSFSAPLPSILSAVMLLFAGHMLPSALENIKSIGGITYQIALAACYILPNLEKFNIRNLVVHNISIPPAAIIFVILYASFYISFLLVLASLIFKKREL